MLHVRTLCASEISFAGTRVGAEQPMTFALLLLLAIGGNAGPSRRELAAALWPDVADRDRNHRLRSLLHRLRRLGAPLACSGPIISLGSVVIDFREFVTLPASLDIVRERVTSIGPVLPGLPASSPALADRLDDIRDVAVGTVMRWLAAASALARAAGDWTLVEQLVSAAEQVDPSDDRLALERAEAACLTGDRRRAIALLDELTARSEPDEETSLAAARLRRRITAELGAEARASTPPLVGREAIVRRLWSAVSHALAGRGSAIVVWGPAGVGKTRLLRELETVHLTGSARLVRLDARPAHALRPFGLILDLAGCLLEEPGAAGCDPRAYALLARSRSAVLPNDPARPIDAVGEDTFCHAVAELLAAVCDETPTVLTIDDMHVVDGAIWSVLRGLVRWSGDRRLLWVFAYRALRETELAALPEASVIQRIRVQCLDPAAAALLTKAIAPPSIDHEQLFQVAGGHPLLLQAVARTGGAVPAELDRIIDDWIARLPAEVLRALCLVATLGSVTPKDLADLGVFDRAELVAALDELERAGMIRAEHGALRAHRVWAVAALATAARAERTVLDPASLRSPTMSER